MHDWRVNDKTLVFGNQGALFKSAMTWWDQDTRCVWSQPWGTSIIGPLKGTALTLIPASIVPWGTWRAEHPETTVLGNDLGRRRFGAVMGRNGFVIGVSLGEFTAAYPYRLAFRMRVINDRVGDHPIVVFVNPETRDIKVYLRVAGTADSAGPLPPELVFQVSRDGPVIDIETGSVWDPVHGLAIGGPLKGAVLQQVPYISAFGWAWRDLLPPHDVLRNLTPIRR